MYNTNLKTVHFPAQTDAEIRDITIGDLLREIAAKYPDAMAVQEIDDSGQNARAYTYAELLTESEQLVLALSSCFQLSEKIVVWAPNQPEWILMEYACALAGLVLVTANPSFQARELRYALEQSGAVALFYVAAFRGNPMTGIAGEALAGCRMLLIRQFKANRLAELIEREGVTTFFAVPTMLVALLESLAKIPRDMTSMHSITSGGAPVAPDLVRHVKAQLGCHFQSAFGQTESSPMISLNHPDVSLDEICTSAGQPLPQCEVSIRSPEDNSVLGIGEAGEIGTRSYAVMLGYHANESATQAAIDAEGWLHTGDLGTLDEKGFIRVTGRLKDMIIRGGENHFPAEIEYVLITHDSVAEVAVVVLDQNSSSWIMTVKRLKV